MISELINKQDNSEIIRDQIAAILALESESQMGMANLAGHDQDLWKLRVFRERSNPFEQWLNIPSDQRTSFDQSPIINVWYASSNFDPGASTVIERQATEGIFNIDCYGCGVSSNNPAGGHNPGDREAALAAQRALRLVRNILMAGEYTYLGLRKLVWQRFPQSINVFQPQFDSRSIQQIVGARLALKVTFNEFSPQVPAVNLEYLSVQVDEDETGELLVKADYQYTPV